MYGYDHCGDNVYYYDRDCEILYYYVYVHEAYVHEATSDYVYVHDAYVHGAT